MATLVRWRPWREMDQMQRRMQRMFDDRNLTLSAFPSADVFETDDEVVVEIEAPGFDEKEIDVEVSENALVIRGERTHEAEQKEKTFWLHERLENMFERRFERPRGADAGKVSASFAKGVLSVHAPKAAVPTTRKVPIGT